MATLVGLSELKIVYMDTWNFLREPIIHNWGLFTETYVGDYSISSHYIYIYYTKR